jgi:hypothetical protein
MGEILHFIRPTDAFDPETLEVLGTAYDTAIASLHEVEPPAVVREVIAKRIIDAARKGERDPAALCAIAVAPIPRS